MPPVMKRELADGLHVLTAYTSVLQRLPYASVTSLIPAQGQALLCNHARIADFKQKKSSTTPQLVAPDPIQYSESVRKRRFWIPSTCVSSCAHSHDHYKRTNRTRAPRGHRRHDVTGEYRPTPSWAGPDNPGSAESLSPVFTSGGCAAHASFRLRCPGKIGITGARYLRREEHISPSVSASCRLPYHGNRTPAKGCHWRLVRFSLPFVRSWPLLITH